MKIKKMINKIINSEDLSTSDKINYLIEYYADNEKVLLRKQKVYISDNIILLWKLEEMECI